MELTYARSTLLIFFFVLGLSASAQEPTFRSQTNLVLVPTLVRDANGKPVYGLQAKDFVVEDDGIQQIVQLDEAAGSNPVSLVVAIQRGRRASYEFPRIQGLYSMLQPILDQADAEIALVEFDSTVNLTRDFTSDGSLIVGLEESSVWG